MAAVGVLLGLKVLCDRHRWTDLVLVFSQEGEQTLWNLHQGVNDYQSHIFTSHGQPVPAEVESGLVCV